MSTGKLKLNEHMSPNYSRTGDPSNDRVKDRTGSVGDRVDIPASNHNYSSQDEDHLKEMKERDPNEITHPLSPSSAFASESHPYPLRIPPSQRSLLILNLPLSCTETLIIAEYSRFGSICNISLSRPTHSFSCFFGTTHCYLKFAESRSAIAAKRYMDEHPFQGIQLRTYWADDTDPAIFVTIPDCSELINGVADHMVELGDMGAMEFEEKLRVHPKFDFLNNRMSPEYTYLKWRIVSSLCPDFTKSPFRLLRGGVLWIPPPLAQEKQTRFAVGGEPLSPSDIPPLTAIIKTINSTRNSVKSAMMFCIDRSHASAAIVALIMSTEPLIADGQIGRLYLISDLLFNAACDKKSAWSFRSAIETCLPAYFSRMHSLAINSDRIRERFARTVSVWDKWNMFNLEFLDGLRIVWGDLRNKFIEPLVPITIVENPDLVEIEMKNFGLVSVGDGHDAARFQTYLKDMYGVNADVDGESLTASDLEDIDGTPLTDLDRTGWSLHQFSGKEEEPIVSKTQSTIGSFKLKMEPACAPNPPQKVTTSQQVHVADIARLFVDDSLPLNTKRKPESRDEVILRKYRGYKRS